MFREQKAKRQKVKKTKNQDYKKTTMRQANKINDKDKTTKGKKTTKKARMVFFVFLDPCEFAQIFGGRWWLL